MVGLRTFSVSLCIFILITVLFISSLSIYQFIYKYHFNTFQLFYSLSTLVRPPFLCFSVSLSLPLHKLFFFVFVVSSILSFLQSRLFCYNIFFSVFYSYFSSIVFFHSPVFLFLPFIFLFFFFDFSFCLVLLPTFLHSFFL